MNTGYLHLRPLSPSVLILLLILVFICLFIYLFKGLFFVSECHQLYVPLKPYFPHLPS